MEDEGREREGKGGGREGKGGGNERKRCVGREREKEYERRYSEGGEDT